MTTDATALARAAEAAQPGVSLAELERMSAEAPNRAKRRKADQAAARARRRAARAELDDEAGHDRHAARVRHLDARQRRKRR